MNMEQNDFGALVRDWRKRRRRSQLELAVETPMSQRHLSFLESGRARPSRETVGRLAAALDLPPRAMNALYLAAGFAPARPVRSFDDPALEAVRGAARAMLAAANPAPALAVDRHWNLIEANPAAMRLMKGVADALLEPPVNVLKLSLHPEGLAPRLANFREWRAHLTARLTREAELAGDSALTALRDELLGYPVPRGAAPGPVTAAPGRVAIPLSVMTPLGRLDLMSATTVFGGAEEVTSSELVIESFWPVATKDRAMLEEMANA
ncbi:helix-turn-helix transcriptional regulator [Pikeienuella piscinae]|uniref:Helix-turn-helix transcriptional regulator n=1 Tax=Pikeienuella piscinae TaxID=2748098 RepID=A0A7L5BXV0_9RHOB|nr:helix-turn-helix domain-containing protein [Pikeienuella piscinae]QIE54429.1 helix-turn-helix transcriptional regulator [Pikeienuella piscinae]